MTITRVTAVWTGFTGAPGYSNFFFDAFGGGDVVDAEVERVQAFFTRLSATLPSSVRINVQPEVALVDEMTGDLEAYRNVNTAPAGISGTASGTYSAPSGAAITWSTDTVNRGRRIRGRTFIVPMGNTMYEANGTLSAAALSDLNAAATALRGTGSGPTLVVWSRPRPGGGAAIGPVTGHRVTDKAAVLRSRRD